MSRVRHEVVLDSNAVSKVCRGRDDAPGLLTAALRRLDAVLTVTPTVLMENYVGAAEHA
jgi:hypothetical protein